MGPPMGVLPRPPEAGGYGRLGRANAVLPDGWTPGRVSRLVDMRRHSSLCAAALVAAVLGGCESYYRQSNASTDPDQAAAVETMTLQQALTDPESAPQPPGTRPRAELPEQSTAPIDD